MTRRRTFRQGLRQGRACGRGGAGGRGSEQAVRGSHPVFISLAGFPLGGPLGGCCVLIGEAGSRGARAVTLGARELLPAFSFCVGWVLNSPLPSPNDSPLGRDVGGICHVPAQWWGGWRGGRVAG